jgi:hypothetical protein
MGSCGFETFELFRGIASLRGIDNVQFCALRVPISQFRGQPRNFKTGEIRTNCENSSKRSLLELSVYHYGFTCTIIISELFIASHLVN